MRSSLLRRWNRVIEGQYKVFPAQPIPPNIKVPYYAKQPNGAPKRQPEEWLGQVKTPEQIKHMRKASRIAANVLRAAVAAAKEGVTTHEVDKVAHEACVAQGAYPVGVNFHGFPKAICASPNNVCVHGIPDNRPLQDGDICNFDVAICIDGYYGDTSAMVMVGDVNTEGQQLVQATKEAMDVGIDVVRPGLPLAEVGRVIAEFAGRRGYQVHEQFCGHFIGQELHMAPNVLHTPNRNKLELKPGMTFTIEPILMEGSTDLRMWGDQWTYASVDGLRSAQWEHTVLVTDNGAEILTIPE